MRNKPRYLHARELYPNEHFVPIEYVKGLLLADLKKNGVKLISEYMSEYYHGSMIGYIIKSDVPREKFDKIVS